MKQRSISIVFMLWLIVCTACGTTQNSKSAEDASYMMISQEEAKAIMESEENYILLDVRTQEEYDQGHIPGAILIPDFEIEAKAERILADKNQLILVYCRSGRRSKNASDCLVRLGYTNVREFGGIMDWEGSTEIS